MFLPASHRRAIERTMALGVEKAKGEIAALTRTWATPPTVEERTKGDDTLIVVTDKRWVFADEGTRPHVIRPKRAKVLRFTTSAGVVFAKKVNHPGQKAQYLTKKVQAKVNTANLAQTFSDIVGSLTR